MNNLEELRSSIFEKLMAINDRDYLVALNKYIANSSFEQDVEKVSEKEESKV
jgi:hypothetical protein